jgi:hypothetical protein
MYDWVNQYYPYANSLSSYDGRVPAAGLAAVNGNAAVGLSTMLSTLYSIGYAGAMPWAVDDTCCGSWSSTTREIASFASAYACVTHY